jgi:hypothetical protein
MRVLWSVRAFVPRSNGGAKEENEQSKGSADRPPAPFAAHTPLLFSLCPAAATPQT